MAMIHAGLPMKSLMVAVSCCIMNEKDEFVIDPTEKQEKVCQACTPLLP